MTRTALTKLTATALTVASLGLASSAQAADQSIAIGEPTPGSGVPTQPAQPTGGDGDYHGPEDGTQAKPATERPKTCKELQEMGYRIGCPEDGTAKKPKTCKELFEMGFKVHCPGGPDSRPGEHDKPHYEEPHKPNYEKPNYEKTEPVQYKKAEEPREGSLPFTGLEIWQLGLIGIVLAGGGIGARRLLVS